MNSIGKITLRIKNRYRVLLKKILIKYFKKEVDNKKFCIISNDCWGGEIYKALNRPFNTPFIGLMIMSPCYIKLLGDLKSNLNLPLNFKDFSKYPGVQDLQTKGNFPIGVLGNTDIEIIFLHYRSEEIAKEKWQRRTARIDWQNLFIKYDCGKDYAGKESVEEFIAMPFSNKLVFGRENFGIREVFVLEKYSSDALVQFRNCFLSFSPFSWLNHEPKIKNFIQKRICMIAAKYL